MLLLINGDRLVKDVQHDFSSIFPYLKLEFFRANGIYHGQALKENQVKHDQQLRLAKGRDMHKGDLLIEETMSVADLEKAFKEKFGLMAQVFRRSGNIWLETSVTDSWTLKQQNELGKEISIDKIVNETSSDEVDYDLNRDAD